MDRQAYKEEIKFQLGGGVLELELDDAAMDALLNSAMREVQRYISTTKLVTVPFKQCIDFTGAGVYAVTNVFRTTNDVNGTGAEDTDGMVDPMWAMQWQMVSAPGNMYNFSDYVLNYSSWSTVSQIRNTLSTDLAFRWEEDTNRLYINASAGLPDAITVEYVPRYADISDVKSDYWIDVLMRMSVAMAKVVLGRIRSRYTQSNALWTQDGSTMLEEGNRELSELREHLLANSQLCYPMD